MSKWYIYIDASTVKGVSACGAWIAFQDGSFREKYALDLVQSSCQCCINNSNLSELAVLRILSKRLYKIANRSDSVVIFTDSRFVIDAVSGRIPKMAYTDIIESWVAHIHESFGYYQKCRVMWIPRDKNKAADSLSKMIEKRRDDRVLVYGKDNPNSIECRLPDRDFRRIYSIETPYGRKIIRK